MRKYLFYISELYGFSIVRPIQRLIRARGDEVAWFFENSRKLSSFLKPGERFIEKVEKVKCYNPCAVLAPGNVVPDFFPGIKVQLFHGLATDLTGKKGHYKIRGFFDLYCTRSNEETLIFKELGLKHPHYEVVETGWPKMDPLFLKGESDILKYKLHSSKKPIVFYTSTFSPSLTSAPILVNTVKKLSQTGKYQWIVTLHPKTDEKIKERYRAIQSKYLTFYEGDQDILPLLRLADVMLSDTSSIALEFMLLEKPVVSFRAKKPAPYLFNVTETAAIESAINNVITRPDGLMKEIRDFAKKIHPYRDGKSSERVLSAIDHMLENGSSPNLSPKPRNIWRKIKIRHKIKYYYFK